MLNIKTNKIYIAFALSLIFPVMNAHSYSSSKKYCVVNNKLYVRLRPNKNGKITNSIYKGQIIYVLERKNGYVRISNYYDGNIEGISGKVARWVYEGGIAKKCKKYKLTTHKKDNIEKYIYRSDDFALYKKTFIEKSYLLYKHKMCSYDEFAEQGGWTRSQNYKHRRMYFIFCGGYDVNHRIYLDVKTGELFKGSRK